MTVNINIRPGEHNNNIDPKSDGKVTVAILSSANFSAPGQVDMTSLTFGHTGDEKSLAFCNTHREDADHDGYPDLVCLFYTDKTNFQKGDTIGTLKGKLLDGTPFEGTDSVHIVP